MPQENYKIHDMEGDQDTQLCDDEKELQTESDVGLLEEVLTESPELVPQAASGEEQKTQKTYKRVQGSQVSKIATQAQLTLKTTPAESEVAADTEAKKAERKHGSSAAQAAKKKPKTLKRTFAEPEVTADIESTKIKSKYGSTLAQAAKRKLKTLQTTYEKPGS